MYVFVSEKCVLFFEKSEVIFTKWCFIFVLFFDKSDYDHCVNLTRLIKIEKNLPVNTSSRHFVPGSRKRKPNPFNKN